MIVRQGRKFHFRRAVPEHLRQLVGKREIWASLGTSSATVARAFSFKETAATENVNGGARAAGSAATGPNPT